MGVGVGVAHLFSLSLPVCGFLTRRIPREVAKEVSPPQRTSRFAENIFMVRDTKARTWCLLLQVHSEEVQLAKQIRTSSRFVLCENWRRCVSNERQR